MGFLNRGFTLTEILVCLAIIALLAAILFPVLSNAKQNGYKATCQSNLRTVGQTVRMYVDDYDGVWADYQVWSSWNSKEGTFPPARRPKSFPRLAGCPLVEVPPERALEIQVRGYIIGYAYNIGIDGWNMDVKIVDGQVIDHSLPTTDKDFIYPATTVTFFDAELDAVTGFRSDPYKNASPYPYGVERGWERHNGGGNYLFADGHVELLHAEQVLPGDAYTNDGTKPSFALSTRDKN